MAEDPLQERLRALSAEFEWPPTPDLAAAVSRRLGLRAAAPSRMPRRALWLALAAAFLVAIAVAATPGSREVVAGWLGLTRVTVKLAPRPASPFPSNPAEGERRLVSLAEARSSVAFGVLVPSGPVTAVYLVGGPPGGEVQFEVAGGTLVTEAGGSFEERILGKVVGPGTDVSAATVRGRPGAWIHGSPHGVAYLDSQGSFRLETLRVAGNVLVWEEGRVVIRVEGAPTETEALAIAAGLR